MIPGSRRPGIRVAVFWAYTSLLMIATHIPNDALPPVEIPWFDKFEHVGAYGLWTLLLCLSGLLGNGPYRTRAVRALLWAGVIAVGDELLQMIPAVNRVADPMDVIADMIGAVCAVCAVWVMERRQKSRGGRS